MSSAIDEKKMFCKLCGGPDRQKLDAQIPMSYDDFERITYILDILKFRCYEIEFWNTFQAQFTAELSGLEQERFNIEEEVLRYTKWLMDFCDQIKEPLLKHLVKGVFELDD